MSEVLDPEQPMLGHVSWIRAGQVLDSAIERTDRLFGKEIQDMFNESDALGLSPYSARRNLHHVVFRCDAPQAKEVRVVGDFNGWNPSATPMGQQPDGQWMVSLELTHGFHEYLFLVDGKPVLDPNATGNTRNALYERVSLLAVS